MISTYAWVSGGELPSQRLRSYTFGLAAAIGFLGAVSTSHGLSSGLHSKLIAIFLVVGYLHCALLHQPRFVELGVNAISVSLQRRFG